MRGQKHENVELFNYLKSFVTNTDEVDAELKARFIARSTHCHALGHSLKKIYCA
jgi:hypothetical protein